MSDRLVFGHMHEDHSTELSLVANLPVNRALVIASGGDLAFALAGAGMHVVAVDSNLAQIEFVKRKMADPENALALCFDGRVDRTLRIAGPFIAWLMDWPRLQPGPIRGFLTNSMEALLGVGVSLIHGRAAARKVNRAAVGLLRTRLEKALRQTDAASRPFLQVLLGKRFGSKIPDVWSVAGIARWKTALNRIELRTADLGKVLTASPPGTFGLISVSNLFDTMDGSSWNALVMQAAAALKPGGYLIARSMLQEEISSPADRLFSREPRIPGDASPLCPVVWIGRKHESIGA